MTKKDVVALAEELRMHNQTADARIEFTPDHLRVLADFCALQYPDFNWERWINYIAGMDREEGTPKISKKGPRLTANRQQQKTLQSLLRQLRMDAGLKQKDVAKALGKPQAFVSYYETGARRLDLLELRQVCEVLGISLGGFVRKFEKRLLDPTLPARSTPAYLPRRLPGRRLAQPPTWTHPFNWRHRSHRACPLFWNALALVESPPEKY
jgi:transcriptional regulator with XRE-family HTH domain